MKIAHIINPVKVNQSSDLSVAQPVSFESMEVARQFCSPKTNVELFAVQYPEDHLIIPEYFKQTRDLTRSVLDIRGFKIPRKLPLVKDILDLLYDSTTDEYKYLIYTNVDIGLQPYFYETIATIAVQGYDAFIVNRRTIPDLYRHPAELPLIWGEMGESHKGWDCFVFKRNLYPRFRLGTTCIGTGWFGRVMITNMASLAQRFKIFTDLHLTFHIGNEKLWKSEKYSDYLHHNLDECRKILEAFERELGPFDRAEIPGRFFHLLKKDSQIQVN
jgi:hypothetical protein